MIPVGYARRAHGVGGEVAIRSTTDDPERWVAGSLFITDEDPFRTLEASSVRSHKGDLLVSFVGIDDRDAAEALRGVTFHVEAAQRRTLGEGEYWPDELVGCSVVSPDGPLGIVVGVEFGAGQDRLIVETDAGDPVEVPLVEAIVEVIDVDSRLIRMTPPKGLF